MAMLTPALSPDTSLRSGSHEHVSAVPTIFRCGSSTGPYCAASDLLRNEHGSSPDRCVVPFPSSADALVTADDEVGLLLGPSLTCGVPLSLLAHEVTMAAMATSGRNAMRVGRTGGGSYCRKVCFCCCSASR